MIEARNLTKRYGERTAVDRGSSESLRRNDVAQGRPAGSAAVVKSLAVQAAPDAHRSDVLGFFGVGDYPLQDRRRSAALREDRGALDYPPTGGVWPRQASDHGLDCVFSHRLTALRLSVVVGVAAG